MNCFSTYPFYAYYTDKIEKNTTKGETIIGDDCWIGLNAIILSGSKIGKGCVIGAGSVVRGEFEPYSVIIGNPAIQVKKRFSNEIIEILESIDFDTLDSDKILEHLHRFYTPLDKNLALEIKYLLKKEGAYNE
ncbi:DapH/DapD/GlmU-related protein [Helicobacter sp. MIT 99-5507]|uniref:DapH/DapD/GlmU-related protein n=1 Tax=Helicobacter sp. MIT 99-5507 TaxID=152489 RepID=UPI000E1F52CB|nr:DapH/DapD/GlmU-related protein [Helicobacter sp. MIT 99-5507]RDU58323.1 hypothetical protein CQA42_00550 [Helicobacter sp. MIT 99-5507]